MGFAIGMEEEKLQEQAIRGVPHKVAADCWFTSTGKMIPRMIKYEDTEGARHLLKDIEVLKSDKKHYAGILMHRYDCRAVVNNRMQQDFSMEIAPAYKVLYFIPLQPEFYTSFEFFQICIVKIILTAISIEKSCCIRLFTTALQSYRCIRMPA